MDKKTLLFAFACTFVNISVAPEFVLDGRTVWLSKQRVEDAFFVGEDGITDFEKEEAFKGLLGIPPDVRAVISLVHNGESLETLDAIRGLPEDAIVEVGIDCPDFELTCFRCFSMLYRLKDDGNRSPDWKVRIELGLELRNALGLQGKMPQTANFTLKELLRGIPEEGLDTLFYIKDEKRASLTLNAQSLGILKDKGEEIKDFDDAKAILSGFLVELAPANTSKA